MKNICSFVSGFIIPQRRRKRKMSIPFFLFYIYFEKSLKTGRKRTKDHKRSQNCATCTDVEKNSFVLFKMHNENTPFLLVNNSLTKSEKFFLVKMVKKGKMKNSRKMAKNGLFSVLNRIFPALKRIWVTSVYQNICQKTEKSTCERAFFFPSLSQFGQKGRNQSVLDLLDRFLPL